MMSSPILDKTAQIKQLQSVCSTMLGDLKGRKVCFEKAKQYLSEVQQLDQMRDWLIDNFKIAKKMVAEESTPEMVQLNEQLSLMDRKIKHLGKILRCTDEAIAIDEAFARDIAKELMYKANAKKPSVREDHFKKEMLLRSNQRIDILKAIECIQAKIEKFDAAKAEKPPSQHTESKRIAQLLHNAELGDRDALLTVSQSARKNPVLRYSLDDIARKNIEHGDLSLAEYPYCAAFRIGKYLLESNCSEVAHHWFKRILEELNEAVNYRHAHTHLFVHLLRESILLNYEPAIDWFVHALYKVHHILNLDLANDLISIIPDLLNRSTNTELLRIIMHHQKTSGSDNYRNYLYSVLNRSDLSDDFLLMLISLHANGVAFVSQHSAQQNAIFGLKISRGEKRFEEWLVKFISKPGMGKRFLLNLNKIMPPAIGPLCAVLDPIVHKEIRRLHLAKKPFSINQHAAKEAYSNYCSLRMRDQDFFQSQLGTECILRLMQIYPEELTEAVFQNVLWKFDMEAEAHHQVMNAHKALLERGKAIPGFTLDAAQKFLQFLIHCTEEDLNTSSLDHQINLFANKTPIPERFFVHIVPLLPAFLVPPALRGYLIDQAPPPDRVLHSIIHVDISRLLSPQLNNAVFEKIKNALRSPFCTPLNLAIATFVNRHDFILGLHEKEEILKNAQRLCNFSGFAATKRA